MAVFFIKYLIRYLEQERSEDDDDLPWNKLTCLAVICYVVKKKHESRKTIKRLDLLAYEYLYAESKCSRLTPRKQEYVDIMKNRMQRISQRFVIDFIPEAQIHFTVPEIDHLSDKDKNNLKRSEILAGFLDFLVQILYREANVDTAREQRYTPLRKSLLFLLAVLGDKPFDCSTLYSVLEDQLKDLLTEFEVLANEAGRFIYSCVFSVRPFDDEMFLLKKLEILNVKIKQHCIKFSELPILAVPVYNVVDSFFIIHSLVDDLDNFSAQNFFKISMFHDELRTLSLVVLECTGARQGDGDMKEPLVQIRDLAYEAEYLINSHVVGNIHAWYLDLRLPSITRKIRFARKKLQRIKELQPSQVMIRHGGEISDVTHATAVDDNHFVELEDNTTEKILSDVVGGYKKSLEIISIYGMPGIGKTTIANKLYHGSSASSYFDRRVWCVVSQTYSVRSLLINILIHVARELKNDEILKKSDEELRLDIHKSLFQRRYLIVLDDVWQSNTWYDLQPYLPDDGNGSRVILTSRIKDASPHGSIFHTLPFFSEDQCLDLLEKKMFPGESCPPELLNIGRRIAKKCSGIPLAVVVAAGILANLKREENAWERVEKQLDTFLLDGLSDYRKILELSYEHLPHHLKPCFLYFAAFPEDAEISVIKLAWRWISEGFIPKNEVKTPEQVAEMYLSDLMNRSLVLPGQRRADGRTKTCRIHDLLLDVCVKKASEENFLNCDNELSIYEKYQRSYLPHTSNTDSRPFGLYCRSLIGGLPDRSSCFQTRALLKVLDIMPNMFHKFDGTSFDLPIHLRYLGVNHLTNKMVANLDNLEFINIVNSSQITVPSMVLRMKKLRHLIVKKEAIFEDNDYISETTNLRTLLYVCIYKRLDEMILRDTPHLLKLKCKVGGKIIFPDTSFLGELKTLKMIFEVVSFGRGANVSNLKFPSSVKNLCLSNANIPWKQMSVIGKLPNLRVLKLEDHAFVGDEWETLDDEFKELRFLKIEQSNLKHWITCSEQFPKLERLVLFGCMELVEIPYDLCDSSTLERIDLEFCSIRACLSAIRIEREKHNNRDEEFQVNITMKSWTKKELEELSEKIEKAENISMMESDGSNVYDLSSIVFSPERDFLVRNDGEQVKVNSLKGKIIGIYFSTFLLKSCQIFNQKLLTLYNAMKKYGHFEIIFVSDDKDVDDESSNFDLSKLPWLAVPLTNSETRNKLNELFNVQKMPHLVILDENGKVLTEKGVQIIDEDGGRGYPFVLEDILKAKKVEKEEDEAKRNESLESFLVFKTPDYVINNNETKIPVSSFVGKTTMLFFASQSHVSSRIFLQKLVHVYQGINEKTNNSLEVIFISHDIDQFSFDAFFSMMPWLALPFGDDRIKSLYRLFKVKMTPMVVVIGPTGKTLTTDGYKLIELYGVEAYPFTPERLKEIESENNKMAKLWPKKVVKEVHEHELCLVKCEWNDYGDCNQCIGGRGYYCENCYFIHHPKCALCYDDMALESLLVSESRDHVIDSVGKKIPVSNLVGKTKMLFFACDWSSLHRSFIPKLVQAYQEINMKYNNLVEVIFISYNKDQLTFNEFFAKMPWLAIPFDDDRRESLTRLFRVHEYLPYVVIIGPTGKTLTVEGYKLISCHGAEAYPFTLERIKEIESKNDIMAESWPKKAKKEVHEHELRLVKRIECYICDGCDEWGWDWSYRCADCDFDLHPKCALGENDKVEAKRNDSLESLLISKLGDYVIYSDGTRIKVSNLVGKTIMIFFAAYWCPPCQFVLPELLRKYEENNEKHNYSVEVIFVSSDKDRSSFDKFFAMMPWLALPFDDYRGISLRHLFKVKAIPMLVTIEPTGKTAANNAWELISYPGAEAYPFTYEWVQSQTKGQKMVVFWPRKVTNKLHDHELCLVQQILYDCDCCYEVGFDWSYKCEECVFSLHPNCALLEASFVLHHETLRSELGNDSFERASFTVQDITSTPIDLPIDSISAPSTLKICDEKETPAETTDEVMTQAAFTTKPSMMLDYFDLDAPARGKSESSSESGEESESIIKFHVAVPESLNLTHGEQIESASPIECIYASSIYDTSSIHHKSTTLHDESITITISTTGKLHAYADLELIILHASLRELQHENRDIGNLDLDYHPKNNDYLFLVKKKQLLFDQQSITVSNQSFVSLLGCQLSSVLPPHFLIYERFATEEEWGQACVVILTEIDHLMNSLTGGLYRCPDLAVLFLLGENTLSHISSSFFNFMPALSFLDLSGTTSRSLPSSLFTLTQLQVLLLRNCPRLVKIPTEIENLHHLQVLDLSGTTELHDLPGQVGKLTNLKEFQVSLYGPDDESEHIYLPSELLSGVSLSKLQELEALSIVVHPEDHRWRKMASDVIEEIIELKNLRHLQFYFPEIENLETFIKKNPSWDTLRTFKLVVGHDVKRIAPRVPDEVEFRYDQLARCVRFVNGDCRDLPQVIKRVVERATAFCLDHHLQVHSLTQFGISYLKELKFCVVRECPNFRMFAANKKKTAEAIMPSLEFLGIHYLWKLQRIWSSVNMAKGSFNALKYLTVYTCPRLKFILSASMLMCLISLEELLVVDCEAVTKIIEGKVKNNVMNNTTTRPHLRKVELRNLLRLVSLGNGICETRTKINVVGCPSFNQNVQPENLGPSLCCVNFRR